MRSGLSEKGNRAALTGSTIRTIIVFMGISTVSVLMFGR